MGPAGTRRFGQLGLDTACGFGIMNAGQRGSARVERAVERCWRHRNDRAERVAPGRNVHDSFGIHLSPFTLHPLARIPSFLCHALAGGGLRHPHGAGITRA